MKNVIIGILAFIVIGQFLLLANLGRIAQGWEDELLMWQQGVISLSACDCPSPDVIQREREAALGELPADEPTPPADPQE